jgi:hypothetical protein
LRITSGKFGTYDFIIDNDDVERIKPYHWCIFQNRNRNDDLEFIYASTGSNKLPSTLRFLHRLINNTQKGFVTDHIDGNTLNTRKSNLRQCTRAENGRNRAISANNSSGVNGVCYDNTNKKWIAYIKYNLKLKMLGYFDTIEDATKAREKAEDEYFGEYTRNYAKRLEEGINKQQIKQN